MVSVTSRVMVVYILRKIKNCLTYANIWVKIWLFHQDYYFTEYSGRLAQPAACGSLASEADPSNCRDSTLR